MDRTTLVDTIYATFAAPYGDHITPALRQQLLICAGQAADRVLAQMSAAIDRATVNDQRVREMSTQPMIQRPPLKERLRKRGAA